MYVLEDWNYQFCFNFSPDPPNPHLKNTSSYIFAKLQTYKGLLHWSFQLKWTIWQ